MTEPTRFSDEERAREALRDQDEEARRLDPAWSEQLRDTQYPASLPDETVYPRERLFSRKALFGWAFGALVFVFIIRMVLPAVFEKVKENIVSKMTPPAHNTAVPPVIAPAPVAPTAVVPAVPQAPAAPEAPVAPAPAKKATK